MKTTRDSIFIVFIPVIVLLIAAFNNSFSNPNGISGRTKKTTSAGCSSCHNFGTGITGTIEGPDSVQTGQTVIFTVTLLFPGPANAGVDIAVKRGSLAAGPGSSFLKLLNGELTHKNPIVFTSTISVDFSYTAPATSGSDTLYATIDRNYTGAWNYIDNRGIRVYNSIGITENQTPVFFSISQNYPNPFNAFTKICMNIRTPGFVELSVFDIKGDKVASPVSSRMSSGEYTAIFDASSLPSGVYFYRLVFFDAKNRVYSETRKMSLVK